MEKESKVLLSIDGILTLVGEFGRFQKLLDGIVCLLYLTVSFQVLITYFTTITPAWQCVQNSSLCLLNGTLPADDIRRCDIPRNEWYYTQPKMYSFVTEFNIDCSRVWLTQLVSSIHFAGWAIGALILGWLGDKYGRKILMFPSTAIILLVGCISSFSSDIIYIVLCRFVIGFFIPGTTMQASILISEVVGNKQRPLAVLLPFLFFGVGYCILSLKAYLLQSWRWLTVACTAPYITTLAFYPFVPESVKWMNTHGRSDEAMNVFYRIAGWNKRELPSNVFLCEPQGDEVNTSGRRSTRWMTSEICPKCGVILHTCIQSFIWFVSCMSFFGLQLAANDLKGSIYRDFVLLSLVQLPAIPVAIHFSNRFGRKKTNVISLLFAGLCCFGVAFIPKSVKGFQTARVAIGIIGKFFVSVTFQGLYVWSNELFPTHIRSKGLGITQVAARIGGASAPWVVKGLKPCGEWVPFVMLALPCLVGSLLGLWLPETRNNRGEAVELSEEGNEGEDVMLLATNVPSSER